VDRARRGEHARGLTPARYREASERTIVLLQLEQRRLARDRDLRERRARGDRRGFNRLEDARERGRVGLRVRDLPWQLCEELALADFGIACLEEVRGVRPCLP